jgi:hypothetical protein
MLHGRDVEAECSPACRLAGLSTPRRVTPSLREGIEDGPRLRVDRLGLPNWQMTQKTAFYLYNKTGSEQFIATSTMAL